MNVVDFYAYQIIILLVAGLLILRTILHVLSGKKKFHDLIVAIIIWGAFAALALFPNLSNSIAHILGFELGINFILTITTIILFAAVVMLIKKTEKNASETTKLVREIALREVKLN